MPIEMKFHPPQPNTVLIGNVLRFEVAYKVLCLIGLIVSMSILIAQALWTFLDRGHLGSQYEGFVVGLVFFIIALIPILRKPSTLMWTTSIATNLVAILVSMIMSIFFSILLARVLHDESKDVFGAAFFEYTITLKLYYVMCVYCILHVALLVASQTPVLLQNAELPAMDSSARRLLLTLAVLQLCFALVVIPMEFTAIGMGFERSFMISRIATPVLFLIPPLLVFLLRRTCLRVMVIIVVALICSMSGLVVGFVVAIAAFAEHTLKTPTTGTKTERDIAGSKRALECSFLFISSVICALIAIILGADMVVLRRGNLLPIYNEPDQSTTGLPMVNDGAESAASSQQIDHRDRQPSFRFDVTRAVSSDHDERTLNVRKATMESIDIDLQK